MDMRKPLCLLMTLAVAPLAGAGDFPLQVKELTLTEAKTLPGNSGGYSSPSWQKPAGIKRTPKSVSSKPLYGVLTSPNPLISQPGMAFMLDESGGTGQGFDRLYVDLNRNGDLTDELPASKTTGETRVISSAARWVNFGPIKLPAARVTGQWQPAFYVEVYLYAPLTNVTTTASVVRPPAYVRFYAANYLETTITVEGASHKAGLVDGNCNFALPDPADFYQPRAASGSANWLARPADYFLCDRNGSGKFERTLAANESERFASIVYFTASPWSLAVSKDLKTLSLEPYAKATGILSLKKDQQELTMAWEKAPNQWEIISPTVKDGKAIVPVGNYRLVAATLGGRTATGDDLKAVSSSIEGVVFRVSAGNNTPPPVGLPLSLDLTASKTETPAVGLLTKTFAASKDTTVRMNVAILGAAKEKYSSFTEGQRTYSQKPRWEVIGPSGKSVASGDFEYG
jgi:hypothetical protein